MIHKRACVSNNVHGTAGQVVFPCTRPSRSFTSTPEELRGRVLVFHVGVLCAAVAHSRVNQYRHVPSRYVSIARALAFRLSRDRHGNGRARTLYGNILIVR